MRSHVFQKYMEVFDVFIGVFAGNLRRSHGF